jgi:peptidoglycan hydrolase CwlO-like protein
VDEHAATIKEKEAELAKKNEELEAAQASLQAMSSNDAMAAELEQKNQQIEGLTAEVAELKQKLEVRAILSY